MDVRESKNWTNGNLARIFCSIRRDHEARMPVFHSEAVTIALPDIDAVSEWLASVMPVRRSMTERLSQIERYLLNAAKIRGRMDFRYVGVSSNDDTCLVLQLVIDGQCLDHGSIAMCCADGRFFKTYLSSSTGEGPRKQRCYFVGANDAARFLAFTARDKSWQPQQLPQVSKSAPPSSLEWRHRSRADRFNN